MVSLKSKIDSNYRRWRIPVIVLPIDHPTENPDLLPPGMGEVMAALEIAMLGKLPYTSLGDGVFAHPTLAEALNNLFLAMDSSKS